MDKELPDNYHPQSTARGKRQASNLAVKGFIFIAAPEWQAFNYTHI